MLDHLRQHLPPSERRRMRWILVAVPAHPPRLLDPGYNLPIMVPQIEPQARALRRHIKGRSERSCSLSIIRWLRNGQLSSLKICLFMPRSLSTFGHRLSSSCLVLCERKSAQSLSVMPFISSLLLEHLRVPQKKLSTSTCFSGIRSLMKLGNFSYEIFNILWVTLISFLHIQ